MGSGLSAVSKKVDLNGKGLKDLAEVKNLSALRTVTGLDMIDLTKNKLATISEPVVAEIKASTMLVENLTKLILKKNRFTEFPPILFSLRPFSNLVKA